MVEIVRGIMIILLRNRFYMRYRRREIIRIIMIGIKEIKIIRIIC